MRLTHTTQAVSGAASAALSGCGGADALLFLPHPHPVSV